MCVSRVIILDICETAQEKWRGNNNGLLHAPSKSKEEIKSETSGCGSFLLPTSNLLLPSTVYLLLASLINESQQCAVHVQLTEWEGLPPPVTQFPLLGLHFRKEKLLTTVTAVPTRACFGLFQPICSAGNGRTPFLFFFFIEASEVNRFCSEVTPLKHAGWCLRDALWWGQAVHGSTGLV